MISLQRLLDAVGPAVLSGPCAPERLTVTVGDAVIAEPDGELQPRTGDIVLGVNLTDLDAALRLLALCGRRSAAAVLLKAPLAADERVAAAADEAGVALLRVSAGAGWAQVLSLLRAALDSEGLAASAAGLGVAEAGDLFGVADAIARIIDAPVTIEDRSSRVLAYSTRQERGDEARVATIMGRHVPEDVNAHFRRQGVFRRIAQATTPIYVPAVVEGTKPRLVVPVHAGGDVLGSIWAIVPGPVEPERAAAFADAADAAALHLLRRRAEADRQRLALADMVAKVLHGQEGAADAARLLGLTSGPWRVIAVGVPSEDADEAERQRLTVRERLCRFPGTRLRSPAAVIGDVVYGIVHADAVNSAAEARADWLGELAGPAGDTTAPLVAMGGLATTVPGLTGSREQADDTLGLLTAGLVPGGAAVHDEVWATVVLRRTARAASGARIAAIGPLRELLEHDGEHHTSHVVTLYTWLEEMGDAKAAAARLCIHPNTLRHRMRRLREVVDLRLESAEVRAALLLQLTARRYGADGTSVPGDTPRSAVHEPD
ncbi:PucR family transcriptional regulator [Streptomyces sp. NEAU-Y11]|uniref:PucR family transcriptional regulator n=1 Tax=Streptomyces cucumeris TaxID=2962890 RepID=UPI0020C8646D|nr:helix-turn-helix domain-containing protein [Streptomyces sp. NEAU-Y11]MCP9210861.1 helix-turn-helix domain-containing protein [Streptomyces sp. NEAU-Y11]